MLKKKPNRRIGVLTMRKLEHLGAFTGMTAGNALVHRFCDAVDAGEQPDLDDLRAIANALSIFKYGNAGNDRLSQFSTRMGLKKKQGKSFSEDRNWLKHVTAVARYLDLVEQLREEGLKQKPAEIEARAKICAELGIGDAAMRTRIRKWRNLAKPFCKRNL